MSMPLRSFLTTRTHTVFAIAHDLADQRGDAEVTPAHVILAMLRERLNVAAQLLVFHRGIPREVLERDFTAQLPPARRPRRAALARQWSASDERMLEQAVIEARELGTEFHSDEHLVLAFLRDPTTALAQVLARYGVHYDDFRKDIQRVYHLEPHAPPDRELPNGPAA